MILEKDEKVALIKAVFNALPAMVFVVDSDVRIHECNEAASQIFDTAGKSAIKRCAGEILHCVNAYETPAGCGNATACRACIIRRAVGDAFKGTRVVRKRSHIQLNIQGKLKDVFALITASPFIFQDQSLVLLVIEDLQDISELQQLIPICCVCRKIRNDEDTWVALESYFKNTWDADFSHCLCPDCRQAELAKLEVIKRTGTG